MRGKMYAYFLVSMIIVSLAGIYGFDQKEEAAIEVIEEVIPPLVQKALDEKLQKYQKTILDKCRERAYEAAEIYIDSLVAEELKLLAGDTLKFPSKPTRPELRAPIILNDSTAISPIIK